MISVIGYGDEESVQRLRAVIREYVSKFGENCKLIMTNFLKEENAQNLDLIKIYEKAIKEGKETDNYIKYDYEVKENVKY